MGGFVIKKGWFGQRETVEVTNEDAGITVVIALQGATLLKWRCKAPIGGLDLVDGYTTSKEFDEQAGVRSGIMAPFSNRVRGGRYVFGGRRHQLVPAVATENIVFHGFLRMIDFRVVDGSATSEHATVVFETQEIRPNAFAGYPFAVDVRVVFSITLTGMRLRIEAENVGEEDAPWACGWHPYFKLGSIGIEDLQLQVPTEMLVVTDEDLLPLNGKDAWMPVGDDPTLDFREAQPVNGRQLDVAYADLIGFNGQPPTTTITNAAEGISLRLWQQRGLMHVYTADQLDRGPRQSIVTEPIEVLTDALNRPEAADLLSLVSGGLRSFEFGVDIVDARSAGRDSI